MEPRKIRGFMILANKNAKIIDASMGAGKTTFAIKMMNNADEDKRFLFISPYLSEVGRVIEQCASKDFVEPVVKGFYVSKSAALKTMIEDGRNIASTHALFKIMDKETRELIKIQGFILVMDEMPGIVEVQKIRRSEIQGMLDREVIQLSNPILDHVNILRVKAGPECRLAEYSNYRQWAAAERLVLVDDTALMWLLPSDLLDVFEDIYVLTYMFKGQPLDAFFNIFEIPYEMYTLDKGRLVPYDAKSASQKVADHIDKIEVVESKAMNDIGNGQKALSKSWFKSNRNSGREKLRKGLANFFQNVCRNDGGEFNLWTTFKDYKGYIKGKGYTNGFLALNTMATNEFRHKRNVAYAVNVFMNPYEAKFFSYCGHSVDQDAHALSVMLQFIWRSRIRDGESIRVYVPSKRMRYLLLRWMENVRAANNANMLRIAA